MLILAVIPTISMVSAQSQALAPIASGKIGFAVFFNKPMPMPPLPPEMIPKGAKAFLAADTYHFDRFIDTSYGSFDLMVLSTLVCNPSDPLHGIPIPMVAYTNSQNPVVPILLKGVLGIDVVVTDDLDVKVQTHREIMRNITTKIHANGEHHESDFTGIINFCSLQKTVDPEPMPAGNGLVIDIESGRQAVAAGYLKGYGLVFGLGLISTFTMYQVI